MRHSHAVPFAPALWFFIAAASAADAPVDAKLLKLLYAKEVLSYCGISSTAGIAGYQRGLGQLLGGRAWRHPVVRATRDGAWRAAHDEWQNRGLGGFRRWCQEDATSYLIVFESWHQPAATNDTAINFDALPSLPNYSN